jgi:hypothetical protein
MTKPPLTKLIIQTVLVLLMGSTYSLAQSDESEHLLDGMSFNYYYQNGAGLTVAFQNGKFNYEWIVGPRKGNSGKDISYKSRKIGVDTYIVNFHEKHKPDFVTLIFNFEQNVMYSSAILRYGTDNEMTVFSGGIIEHVKR